MNEKTFDVRIDKHIYTACLSGCGTHGTFSVSDGYRTIEESFGCNPLDCLYDDWRYQTARGAAKRSMEKKVVREAVERALEAHEQWALEDAEEERLAHLPT